MFEYVRHIDGMAQASSYHKPIMNQHEPTTLNIFEHHLGPCREGPGSLGLFSTAAHQLPWQYDEELSRRSPHWTPIVCCPKAPGSRQHWPQDGKGSNPYLPRCLHRNTLHDCCLGKKIRKPLQLEALIYVYTPMETCQNTLLPVGSFDPFRSPGSSCLVT